MAAAAAAAIGWWVHGEVDASLRRRIASDLEALVALQATALQGLPADAGRSAALLRLASAGTPGDTGETLLFDAKAALLVPSRFDARMREAGVFPTTLGLDLRDPGGDLAAGFRPTLARASLPLTEAAGHAVSGGSGLELDGYRNWRGARVVGAWRWVPEVATGVAVEVEVEEAYRPLHALERAMWILGVLVATGCVAAAGVARRNAVLLQRTRAAELQARTLGQYTLVKKIGAGGMGEVFLARHALLRRPTAVKILRPESTDAQAVARFEREVQQTSRLTHPNTVQIYDFGRTPGGTFYYAMEYLVGVTLDRFVAEEGPLEEGRVIYILQQVCASLNEAHGLGLVHRDVKPDNIALCRAAGAFDVVKVLDFGLVMDRRSDDRMKLSAPGAMMGSPKYMSPEAFLRPDSVDGRSDIYSLGAVGYFLLTGHAPFEAKNVVELFQMHTKVPPVPPSERIDRDVSPDLEKAILACLEKDPVKRPQTANAVAREFEWCRSFGEWNRDKARHWWHDNEARLEKLYGLTSKASLAGGEGHATMEIRLDGR